MKLIYTIILFFIFSFGLFAQNSEIKNVRIKFTASNDSMIVYYDLVGKVSANNVKLKVEDNTGKSIPVHSVSGHVGDFINPGLEKTIIWNMYADGIDIFGRQLSVKVTSSVNDQNKKAWIPWFYIASGASAATGVLAQLKVNSLHDQYPTSTSTKEAEELRSDIRQFENYRNIAYGAAGAFGVVGIIVHINHNKKKHAVGLSYSPMPDGAVFGLTYNF